MNDYITLDGVRYQQSIVQVEVDGKQYPVRNLIPIFKNEDERNLAKERISNELFHVFRKYVS